MSTLSKKIFAIALLVCLICINCIASNGFLTGTKNFEEIIKSARFYDVSAGFWAREAICTVAGLGIVKGFEDNMFLPAEPVTRVQALAMIYRAAALEEQALVSAKVIEDERRKNPHRVNNIDSWADGYIQLAAEDGLISSQQYMDALYYDQAGLPVDAFRKSREATRREAVLWITKVLDIPPSGDFTSLSSFADSREIDNEAAPYFEAAVRQGIIQGSNGYLYPKHYLTRAEMAQILYNCKNYILEKKGIKEYSGIINPLTDESNIIITNDGGTESYITIKQGEGLAVIGIDNIGTAQLLKGLDSVSYYVGENNEVVLVTVRMQQSRQDGSFVTTGIVQSIKGSSITLYDEEGRTSPQYYRTFNIKTSALRVLNNNRSASLSDIKPNDRVYLKIDGGYVTQISFSKKIEEAYDEDEEYDEYLISNIYKATVDSYDDLGSKLIVKDLKKMEKKDWGYTAHKGYIGFSVDEFSRIYCNNQDISYGRINEYKDSEIYFATQLGMDGSEVIVFARINTNADKRVQTQNGKIEQVGSNRVSLKNSLNNYSVDRGTIIVKNNKLAYINDIKSKDNVYIVSSGSGNTYNAMVLNIEDEDDTKDITVYFARLQSVSIGDRIVISTNRFYDKEKGDWIYTSRKISLKMSNDTIVLGKDGVINNRELAADSVYGDTANIVVSDGEALLISVGESARYSLKARVGSITRDDELKVKSFYVYEVKSYDSSFDEWYEEINGDIAVFPNTIFIKDNKVVLSSELKEGDSVTVFHNGRNHKEGLVVFIN